MRKCKDCVVDHFNRLPVEVLEHILSFINFNLRECLLVNKKFKDAILGSPKLMNRFVLKIDGIIDRSTFNMKNDLNELANLKRLYRKIKITNLSSKSLDTAIPGIRLAGSEATEVIIYGCGPPERKQLLPCFPNLVKLELSFSKESGETLAPTLFPKLKHLKVDGVENVSSFSGYIEHIGIISIHRSA